MKSFTSKAVLGAFLVSSLIQGGFTLMSQVSRNPSSVEDAYEITINNIALDATSRIHSFDNVYLRATFGHEKVVELGLNEGWKIGRGESKPLAIRLDVQRSWIKADDTMDFQLEIVEAGAFNTVLVRCAQLAREVSAYNRSYQCNVPGERTPVLNYRVGRKGSSPAKVNSVAQNSN